MGKLRNFGRRRKPLVVGPHATGNHLPEVFRLGETLGPGLHHAMILHDDWCALLAGTGPCNCEPIVREGMPGEPRVQSLH
jgi:hypothetical protein